VHFLWSECGLAGCMLSGLAARGVCGGLSGPGGRGCRSGPRAPGVPAVPAVPGVPESGGWAAAAVRWEPSQCGAAPVRTVAL